MAGLIETISKIFLIYFIRS